jgi:hypothetical protein
MSTVYTSGLQKICVWRRFPDIVEVWFSDLYGHWRTRFFSVLVTLEDKVVVRFLVILYWLGGLVLPLGFLLLTRLQN